MKKTRATKAATGPKSHTVAHAFVDEEQLHRREHLELAPERIAEGASATTELLTSILAHKHETRQVRHWGINE